MKRFCLQIIFLIGAILGPLVVLTADISKSAVVGGIVGVPVALLVVAIAAAVAPRPKSTRTLFGSQTFGRMRGRGFRIGTVQPTQPGQPALARLRSSRRSQAIGRTRQISDRSRQ